jgi:hypothetical protein
VIVKVKLNGDECGPTYDVSGSMLQQLLDTVSARMGGVARKFFVDTEAAKGILVLDLEAQLAAGRKIQTADGTPVTAFKDLVAWQPLFLSDGGARVADFRWLARNQVIRVSKGEPYLDPAEVKRRRVAAINGPPSIPAVMRPTTATPAARPAVATTPTRPASAGVRSNK